MAFAAKLVRNEFLDGLIEEEIVQTKFDKEVDNYKNSVLMNNQPQDILSVLSLIPSPLAEKDNSDVLSIIYRRYIENTDIPLALPIFSFFAYLGAFLSSNEAKMKIPFTKKPAELDTWVMLLAPTGAAKTLSSNLILDTIPANSAGQKVIKSNFEKGSGAASFVKGLANLPGGRGLWIEDEASQFIKKLEDRGSMTEAREYVLKAKDNKVITRATKNDSIETEEIVLTTLFINTIDSMSKSVSDESMNDGLIRRFQIAIADNDERSLADFALYNINEINDSKMISACHNLFDAINTKLSENSEVIYTFSEKAYATYSKSFKHFWNNQYSKFMKNESESTYRTYMMQSFKYAIFYHEILSKKGLEIDEDDMEWGIKVSLFLLESYRKFLEYKSTGGLKKSMLNHMNATEQEIKILKMRDWIVEAEKNNSVKMRDFQRKYNLKKGEAVEILKMIKTNTPGLKSKLLRNVEV